MLLEFIRLVSLLLRIRNCDLAEFLNLGRLLRKLRRTRRGLDGTAWVAGLAFVDLYTRFFSTIGTLNLTWSSLTRRTYQLQYKTNMNQTTWSNLGNTITATSSTISTSNSIGPDPQRFYRVALLPRGKCGRT